MAAAIIFLVFIGKLAFLPRQAAAQPEQPTAQTQSNIWVAFFGSEGCDNCLELKEIFLPPLLTNYPQVKIRYYNLDDLKNYKLLIEFEKKFQQETHESPVFIIGQTILDGKQQIEERLEPLIQQYLASGGCPLPSVEKMKTSLQEEKKRLNPASSPIFLALFTKPGCQKCDRTQATLRYLQTKYPTLEITQFDVSAQKNILVQEVIAEKIGIPENQALLTPMLVVGEDYLTLKGLTYQKIETLIQKYQMAGSACLWANIRLDAHSSSQAYSKIAERFQRLGPLAILGSGLLDGINPCAFATLVFLISWLAFIGKKGREILWVGTSFSLAVFLTYFLLGLGMFQFLKKLSMLSTFRTILFIIMAAVTFIFGILSIFDYFKIKQGKTKEIALQLPKIFKKRIHQVIKEKTSLKSNVLAAFSMGVTISILELACTGQVYLPTIIAVTGIPSLKVHAISYLALYNLAFILPLIGVFLVTYHGTSSQQLSEVMKRNLKATKLLTGLFFFLMTAVMVAAIILRL